jgi:hypothetical protein
MSKKVKKRSMSDALFGRVAAILEQARSNVVRTVNTTMVTAYWLIGREIVQAIQGGRKRAEYGEQIIENLSAQLTERYGQGYSVPNLKNFRQFYLTSPDRFVEKGYPLGSELKQFPKSYPLGSDSVAGFSPQLSWSHYRALMRVEDIKAREFYEREAIAGGWDKRTLERQIQSYYYERVLKSRKPDKMLAEGRRLPVLATDASEELKNPYVLEFLGLPEAAAFQESDLERAIITHLQRFLLLSLARNIFTLKSRTDILILSFITAV